ncbi:MAG: hypothetical protein FWG33_05170, partial [Oscillospiraceae bacterium]|nr:hypothetical protein [Oscillospiraceae bacterium]
MFSKSIYSTQLTGDVADRLFSNITASGALDVTFLTTMRALLRKRVPENETVHLVCNARHFSLNEILSVSTSQVMGWFIPEEVRISSASANRIYIVYTTHSDTGEKMLETVRANAGNGKRYMPGYTLCEDLRVFYARKLNGLFYHNAEAKTTVIFTDKMEYKHFHALQMMLPKYLPALFRENPLTENETSLLKSLG